MPLVIKAGLTVVRFWLRLIAVQQKMSAWARSSTHKKRTSYMPRTKETIFALCRQDNCWIEIELFQIFLWPFAADYFLFGVAQDFEPLRPLCKVHKYPAAILRAPRFVLFAPIVVRKERASDKLSTVVVSCGRNFTVDFLINCERFFHCIKKAERPAMLFLLKIFVMTTYRFPWMLVCLFTCRGEYCTTAVVDVLIQDAPCSDNDCQNGGECYTENGRSHSQCWCLPGYGGRNCEKVRHAFTWQPVDLSHQLLSCWRLQWYAVVIFLKFAVASQSALNL